MNKSGVKILIFQFNVSFVIGYHKISDNKEKKLLDSRFDAILEYIFSLLIIQYKGGLVASLVMYCINQMNPLLTDPTYS